MRKFPHQWIPSLYLTEGLPFALISGVSVIFFKNFNFNNTEIAFYTSLFTIPFFIKPLLAPLMENIFSKRAVILCMLSIMTTLLLLLALSLKLENFLYVSLAIFFIISIASAIYDINADGFYITHLATQEQARFIGVCNVSYQIGRLICQSGSVYLASLFFSTFSIKTGWQIAFLSIAIILFFLMLHQYWILPRQEKPSGKKSLNFIPVIKELMQLPFVTLTIIFVLIYNLTENQLIKIVPLFLLDNLNSGGLQLTTAQVGLLSGLSVAAMLLGILLTSFLLTRFSLKNYLLPITIFAGLSNLGYLFLSLFLFRHFTLVAAIIIFAQFGYGLSNAAYMLCLMKSFGRGTYPMSTYAIGTALMGLSSTVGGAISGYIQSLLGYQLFFIWIVLISICIMSFCYFFVKKEII